MCKTILFLLLSCIISGLYAEEPVIKSLKIYSGKDQTSLPVLVYDQETNDQLTVQFDVQAPYEPNFSIVFRFCDKNWNPTRNLLFANPGQNTAYNLAFDRLPSTVREASYHYRGVFPDPHGYVSFPFSGKWRLYITDSQDTSVVYATGKFIVVRDPIKTTGSIKRESLEDKAYFPTELSKVFNVTVNFSLPEELYPQNVREVEIIENHKIEYPYTVDRGGNNQYRFYNWDGRRDFSFTSREIRPGNEYRQTDLRNSNVFNTRDVNAQIDGVEVSRFFSLGKKDLNGASVLTRYKDPYADYLNVKFRLRTPTGFSKDVFLVGAFNDWKVLPEYRMDNDNGLFSIVVNMKRGVFDYQYVAGFLEGRGISELDWNVLEGNDWETVNDYYAFVYYADPDKGGYDRIIGYQKLTSK